MTATSSARSLLAQAGLPAKELEAHAARFLDLLKAKLPAAAQLSVTIAQEHFTAIMAQLVLTDGRMTAGAGSRLSAMWRWHALEEMQLLKADPLVRRRQGLGKFLDFLFVSPGLLLRLALPWLACFRPGFHP